MAATCKPFVCGGAAACISSAIIHPMDLAKTRLQLVAMQVRPCGVGYAGGLRGRCLGQA
jgi:hypothetical protein